MERLAIVLGLAGGLAACKGSDKKPEAPPAPVDAASVAKARPPSDAAPAMDPVTVNPELRQMIADVVASCTIDDGWLVSDCNNGELDKISAYAPGTDDFYASLGEIGVSDGATDPRTLRAVIAAAASTGIGTGKDWFGKNASKAAAERWLALAATLPDDASSFAAMAAAIPATAGMTDALAAVIGKRADGDLKGTLIISLASYAFASALPVLTELVAHEQDDKMKWDAVESIAVAMSPPWSAAQQTMAPSDADKTKLCDWAKRYLADPDPKVADAAASSLGACGGAYIDAALDALTTRVAREPLDGEMSSALAAQCASDSNRPVNGTPAQCGKALALLEQGAQQPGLSSEDLDAASYSVQEVAKLTCHDAACTNDVDAFFVKIGKRP